MPSFNELSKTYKHVRNIFGTPIGLLVTLLGTAGILVTLFSSTQFDLSKITFQQALIILASLIFVTVVWYFKRLPRGSKDKMTIGLAISRDTSDENQFYQDFLLNLKKNLRNSKSDEYIEIIELPLIISEDLYTNKDFSKKIMQQCMVDLLFAGKFFERDTSSGPTTMMDMLGIAKHRRLSEKEYTAFQKTFACAIPQRYQSERKNRFNLCEFAAQHIHGVTNAIIGITVLLNGKYETAEVILLEAEKSLKLSNQQISTPYISQLLGSIREYLHDLYIAWMLEKTDQRSIDQTIDNIREIDRIIKKAESQGITPASLASFKAQVEFLLRNDINSAREATKLLKEVEPSVYYYNMAFLSAYEENLDEAYRHYNNAFNQTLSDALVPWQCEDFIQKIIVLDASKKYLYFCTGLINFRAKNDSLLAKKDFQSFLDATDAEDFQRQREAARKWISEIDSKNSLQG